jgi:phage pi2 protein 07
VWNWDPVNKFTFTVEERTVVVPVRHDLAVVRTEEYPTLINVQTEEWLTKDIKQEAKATGRSEDELRAENTILV